MNITAYLKYKKGIFSLKINEKTLLIIYIVKLIIIFRIISFHLKYKFIPKLY